MRIEFNHGPFEVDIPDEAVTLANLAGSSMMDAAELAHLAAAAAAVPWSGQSIAVEIGAYRGQTTAFLAKILKLLGLRVPVLSIDPFERVEPDPVNPQGSYTEYLRAIQSAEVERGCLPLVAFSQDAAAVVPDRIGLLIVDGSHHYSAVSQDLALFGSKVVPGGVIFMDDYSDGYPDVVRAADEYFARESRFDILHKSYFLVARRSAEERDFGALAACGQTEMNAPAVPLELVR